MGADALRGAGRRREVSANDEIELKPCRKTRNWKHGACHRHPRLYNVWSTMLRRCEDRKRAKFPMYGGRGINVCQEWHDPNVFIDWAERSGYLPGLQLDRIDNDKGYSPTNCRWVTRKENCRNTRRNKFITVLGVTKTITEWHSSLGISQYTIYWWYRKFGRKGCEERAVAAWNRRAAQ